MEVEPDPLPVTVTVCGVFQSEEPKVRVAGGAVAVVVAPDVVVISTLPLGWLFNTTV